MKEFEIDLTVDKLGQCNIKSPIVLSDKMDDFMANYQDDFAKILYDIEIDNEQTKFLIDPKRMMEKAGPRNKIYFDPAKTHAAIVTCGGLCPGLNDVVRSIVMCLWYRYNVKRICGVKFGFRGFLPEFGLDTIDLNPNLVNDIHHEGGTILGSSRGYGDRVSDIVDALERMNINLFFPIGGDGTQRGAYDITKEVKRRGLKMAVVGVPKTIDNDLSFVQKSFGFETAVASAVNAVEGAHVEAHDAPNGVGVVKVMGRGSGYIAAHTALARNDVNFVLIPEVPFELEGDNGLFAHILHRIKKRNHAVLLVAEGAGQDILGKNCEVDASGNSKLGDIGVYICSEMKKYFKHRNIELNLKYIDPSYIIRSEPANPNDSLYCQRLGANAVHAAMAGKTGLVIGLMYDKFVHIPIAMATARKNSINPNKSLWRDVIEATGQPPLMKNITE